VLDEQIAKSLWEKLGGSFPKDEDQWDIRSDDYVPAGACLGVKFRASGREGLECKFRVSRKKRGAELWVKSQFGAREVGSDDSLEENADMSAPPVQISHETLDFMRKKLVDNVPGIQLWIENLSEEMKHEYPECKEACVEAVEALNKFDIGSPSAMSVVSLSKKINKVKDKKTTMEVAHVGISLDGGISMPMWTIAVESKEPKKMYSLLESALGDDKDRMGSMAVGYPALVQRFGGEVISPIVDEVHVDVSKSEASAQAIS